MAKKLSSIEFIEKANIAHNKKYDYSKVNYKNTRTKVCIICPEHGEFWQTPKNHLNGQGCPQCGKEYAINFRKGNYDNFVETANNKFNKKYSYPNIDKEYKNKNSIVTIVCNDCGNVFKKNASYHLSSVNGGCDNCLIEDKKEYITYDELIGKTDKKVKPFSGKLLIDNNTKITLICDLHGEYDVLLKTVLDGRGHCISCSSGKNSRVVTKEELVKRIENRYGNKFNYDVDEFVNMSTEMTFICNDCGTEITRKPSIHLNNIQLSGCPVCDKDIIGKDRIKTTSQFIEDAITIHGKDYDYSNTIYTKSNEKVDIRCNKCGKNFSIEANSHLMGHGCPYHYINKSKSEEEVYGYIKSIYKGIVIQNDRTVLNGEELDILLPELNIAIEYDGLYWHSDACVNDNYHLLKTNKCLENGYQLIHIFEDEWLHKKEIVKSRFNNIFGLCNKRIYARKCEIKEVNSSDATTFLDNNHIQGRCGSRIRYGLYYNDELVSLMTFGKTRHFIGNNNYEWELLRFCNKLDTLIVGGASKLLKRFIKEYNPKSIVSYADRRWSVGNLYEKLGFNLYNVSRNNYYYIFGDKRANRFNYRKSILVKEGFDKNKSERQIMKERGIHRIYDCGCLCYELKL